MPKKEGTDSKEGKDDGGLACVRFTEGLLAEMDAAVDRGDYMSRSEVARAGVRCLLKVGGGQSGGKKKERRAKGHQL